MGVLANPDLSQAMAPSKQKRTYTVFRASSAHRSASTSEPRFVGEKVKLGKLSIAALAEPRNTLPRILERRLDSIGKNQRYLKQIATLPVSSTLLQNLCRAWAFGDGFDYQSVRHCSKTNPITGIYDYQFDYQSVRHCSKTVMEGNARYAVFDYQSVRHCSKTASMRFPYASSLITSQFDTAPKPSWKGTPVMRCLITSQFDTAPKR